MPAYKKNPGTRKRRNRASTAATLTVVPPIEVIDYSGWTVKQLKAEIERRNADLPAGDQLGTSGNKAVLIERLGEDDLLGDGPFLPDRPQGWHDMTRLWWETMWESPMSNEWHVETDFYNVLMAAVHFEDAWMGEDPGARQKADTAYIKRTAALGLTPYDRRRLEWTIAAAGEATDRRNRRRGATPIGDAGGPPVPSTEPDPRAQFAGATS